MSILVLICDEDTQIVKLVIDATDVRICSLVIHWVFNCASPLLIFIAKYSPQRFHFCLFYSAGSQ